MPVKGKRPVCDECYEYSDDEYMRHIPVNLHRVYIKLTKGGRTHWKGVGWYCPMCNHLSK